MSGGEAGGGGLCKGTCFQACWVGCPFAVVTAWAQQVAPEGPAGEIHQPVPHPIPTLI